MRLQPIEFQGRSLLEKRSLRLHREALRALMVALTLAWFCASSMTAEAQKVREDLYVTNGPVSATALSGNTLYIAGDFSRVGPATGGGVPISSIRGTPARRFPKVTGQVKAVAPDGSGGWYIGGTFSAVGGIPRGHLAHVLADGSVSAWDPNSEGRLNGLNDMALVVSGTTVYVGGDFTRVGGQDRKGIAALDATTGLATPWNPNADGEVVALAVSGSTIYVGGYFGNIGGQVRGGLAALDIATGLATPWNPAGAYRATTFAIAVSGTTVYVGGVIGGVGGQLLRHNLAALDANTGLATNWNPDVSKGFGDRVLALAVSGSTIYVGGSFTGVGGQTRNNIAALDANTGLATAWNPDPDGFVFALAQGGATVYAGGNFRTIGGQERFGMAALDPTSGLATPWNPKADGAVNAFAVSGNTIFAGGDFNSLGGQARDGLAALDIRTGRVTAWAPSSNHFLFTALAVSGSNVYVTGIFSRIGGQARNNIAALDATTGLATAWNPVPHPDGASIYDLTVNNHTVFVSGSFTDIGGQVRDGLAALDPATGLATSWNPPRDGSAGVLAVDGTTVYVSGGFTNIGGQPRNHIAALDATSGLANAWNPNVDGVVASLVPSGATVYVAGQFSEIGGQPRSGLAALDGNGLATPWNPSVHGDVRAFAVSGATVYMGGFFPVIGQNSVDVLVALDATSGLTSAWHPSLVGPEVSPNNPEVHCLAVGGGMVYVGGLLSAVNESPQSGIAAIEAVNSAPDCSRATANPSQIFAYGHKLVPVRVAGITDPDGDRVKITVTQVSQDEPLVGKEPHDEDDDADEMVSGFGQGDAMGGGEYRNNNHAAHGSCPDAVIDRDGGVAVRAERSRHGNGRVYTIRFTASDGRGGSAGGSVQVCVPLNRHNPACQDDGENFSSLGPCPEGCGNGGSHSEITLVTGAHSRNLNTLQYSLPTASDVLIAVFDVAGRRVATLERGREVPARTR